jgi:hypothetical protein
MQRIRSLRPNRRRGRPWRVVLAPDPHDPQVLRAKALGVPPVPTQQVTRR